MMSRMGRIPDITRKKSRSRKTGKRLAAKAVMLAKRATKKRR
jgi:hypothetical protein